MTQNEMAASLRRDGFGPNEIAAMIAPGASIADAPNPTQLRWGLNDVMWGDDDSVIVMLSGPDGEPYWLELDTERAAVLRKDLAGPHEDVAAPTVPQPLLMPHDRAEYDRMRDTNPRPGPCCAAAGPVPHWPMWHHCGGGNGPGKPIRPHCTCNSCF